MSQETYNAIFLASHWLFAFFALMLLLFAFAWHHSDRKERRNRFKNLPGAGTVGELVVLSGSDELRPDTWFPVPREGVLGSLRSCDLVIPCPGVRSQHLDFSWQDGSGLLIRPRAGCDVLVDGVPVSRRGAYADAPLVHGSLLQVGSAVLRLNLFTALSHTNQPFTPQAPVPGPEPGSWTSVPAPSQQPPYAAAQLWQSPPDQASIPVPPSSSLPAEEQIPASQPQISQQQISQQQSDPVQSEQQPDVRADQPQPAQRRRRADRWKEDWSE